jgi:hypothetical protein
LGAILDIRTADESDCGHAATWQAINGPFLTLPSKTLLLTMTPSVTHISKFF